MAAAAGLPVPQIAIAPPSSPVALPLVLALAPPCALHRRHRFSPREASIAIPWRAAVRGSLPPRTSIAIRRPCLPNLRPRLVQSLAAAAAEALAALRRAVLAAVQAEAAAPQLQPPEKEALSALRRGLSCAAAPLCFAAISGPAAPVNTPLTVVASGMAKWLELYSGVLMVRVLLSWFPNIPWERQPLQAIRDMCDPYLNLFRNIIPPLFNVLDLSPLLAFLVLGLLASILNSSIHG